MGNEEADFTHNNTTIESVIKTESEQVILEIKDHGEGFSEEALNTMFEFFAHEDIYHREGLGLGLAAVKLIMDTHQGKAEIANHQSGAIVKLMFCCEEKI